MNIQRDTCTVGLTKGVMGGCQLRSLLVFQPESTMMKHLPARIFIEWDNTQSKSICNLTFQWRELTVMA
jgi:hypothetical protein